MNYFYYKTTTWDNSNPSVSEETKNFWKHLVEKKNWRIVQLPNGFYQTEYKDLDDNWTDVTRRETVEGAEAASKEGDAAKKDDKAKVGAADKKSEEKKPAEKKPPEKK